MFCPNRPGPFEFRLKSVRPGDKRAIFQTLAWSFFHDFESSASEAEAVVLCVGPGDRSVGADLRRSESVHQLHWHIIVVHNDGVGILVDKLENDWATRKQ